jgi:hypothetical protein
MRRIRYAGDSVVTGDVIASVVIEYSEALAKANTAASIDIPVRLAGGDTGMATLLVGPASQLISVPEPDDTDEIVDEELVARLRRRVADLGPMQAVLAENDEESAQNLDDLDFPSDSSDHY